MRMRLIRNLTGTMLVAGMASLAYAWAPALGAAVPAGESMNGPVTSLAAQQQDQAKPTKEDKTKPPKETKNAKPPKAEKQQGHPKQDEKPSKEQTTTPKEQPNQAPRDHGQPSGAHPDHGQPSGGHGRIPDNDFKAHFGRQHHFAVRQVITTTRIVPNQTQFVYGGYTFIFLDPWPDDWALTDDCYIDYVGDEYVLIDVAHPGMQIALSVVIG